MEIALMIRQNKKHDFFVPQCSKLEDLKDLAFVSL